jgi:hypothetical protein
MADLDASELDAQPEDRTLALGERPEERLPLVLYVGGGEDDDDDDDDDDDQGDDGHDDTGEDDDNLSNQDPDSDD